MRRLRGVFVSERQAFADGHEQRAGVGVASIRLGYRTRCAEPLSRATVPPVQGVVVMEGASIEIAGVDEIRSHFPALLRCHEGLPVGYFDGPGGTQVPQRVVNAVTDYLLHHNANTYWAYPTSRETDEV